MEQIDVMAVPPGDDPAFDRFCTQYAESLTGNITEPPDLYWHGRLIGPSQTGEERLPPYNVNFLDGREVERRWRLNRLEARRIIITDFRLLAPPVYTRIDPNPYPGNLDAHVATCRVHIRGRRNTKPFEDDFEIQHLIRRTYHAYETVFRRL